MTFHRTDGTVVVLTVQSEREDRLITHAVYPSITRFGIRQVALPRIYCNDTASETKIK